MAGEEGNNWTPMGMEDLSQPNVDDPGSITDTEYDLDYDQFNEYTEWMSGLSEEDQAALNLEGTTDPAVEAEEVIGPVDPNADWFETEEAQKDTTRKLTPSGLHNEPAINEVGLMTLETAFLNRLDQVGYQVQANVKELLSTGSIGNTYLYERLQQFSADTGLNLHKLANQIKVPEGVSTSRVQEDVSTAISMVTKTFEGYLQLGPGSKPAGVKLSQEKEDEAKEGLDLAIQGIDIIASHLLGERTKEEAPNLYAARKHALVTSIHKKWTEEDNAAVHLRDPVTGLPRYYGEDEGERADKPIMASLRLPMPADFDIMGLATNANVIGNRTGSPLTLFQYEKDYLPPLELMEDGVWPEEVVRNHPFFKRSPAENLALAPSIYQTYTKGVPKEEKQAHYNQLLSLAKFTSDTLREQYLTTTDENYGNQKHVIGRAVDGAWAAKEDFRNEAIILGLERDAVGVKEQSLSPVKGQDYVAGRTLEGSSQHGTYADAGLSEIDLYVEARENGVSESTAYSIAIGLEEADYNKSQAQLAKEKETEGILGFVGPLNTDRERYQALVAYERGQGNIADQGTDEWLDERMGNLTGTAAKFIKTAKQRRKMAGKLAGQDLGLEEREFIPNDLIRQGSVFEEQVKKRLQKVLGYTVEDAYFTTNRDLPGFGVSPDGIVFDEQGNSIGLAEFKLHNSKKALEDGLKNYSDQLQMQMLVTGEDQVHFFRLDAQTNEFKYDLVQADPKIQEELRLQGRLVLSLKGEILDDDEAIEELTMAIEADQLRATRATIASLEGIVNQTIASQELVGPVETSADYPQTPLRELTVDQVAGMTERERETYVPRFERGALLREQEGQAEQESRRAEVYQAAKDQEAYDKEVNVYTSARAEKVSKEEQGYSKNLPKAMQEEMVKRARDVSRTEEAKDFALKEAGITVDTRGLGANEAAEKKMQAIQGDEQAKKAYDDRKKALDLGEQERLEIEKSTESRKKERGAIGEYTQAALTGAKEIKKAVRSMDSFISTLGGAASEVTEQGMDDIRLSRKYGMESQEGRGLRELFTKRGLTIPDSEGAMGQAGSLMDKLAASPEMYGSLVASLGKSGYGGVIPELGSLRTDGDLKEFISQILMSAQGVGDKQGSAQYLRELGLDKFAEMDLRGLTEEQIMSAWAKINEKSVTKTHSETQRIRDENLKIGEETIVGNETATALASNINERGILTYWGEFMKATGGGGDVLKLLKERRRASERVALDPLNLEKIRKNPAKFFKEDEETFSMLKKEYGVDNPEWFQMEDPVKGTEEIKGKSDAPGVIPLENTYSEETLGVGNQGKSTPVDFGGFKGNYFKDTMPSEKIRNDESITPPEGSDKQSYIDIRLMNGTDKELEVATGGSLFDPTANSGTSDGGSQHAA